MWRRIRARWCCGDAAERRPALRRIGPGCKFCAPMSTPRRSTSCDSTSVRARKTLPPSCRNCSMHRIRRSPSPLRIADASSARFRTFDAMRQFFHQATQQVPITLVLDNLHWADAPSLSLLEFLSQELLRSRLLIVGTYRDADASRNTPLQSALGGLIRDSDVERVHLDGLSPTAIGEVAERLCDVQLVCARDPDHLSKDGWQPFVCHRVDQGPH